MRKSVLPVWLKYALVIIGIGYYSNLSAQNDTLALSKMLDSWENVVTQNPDSVASNLAFLNSDQSSAYLTTRVFLAHSFYQWSISQYKESIVYAKRAETIASQKGFNLLLAQSKNLQGVCNYHLGNLQVAMHQMEVAISLFTDGNQPNDIANSTGNLALILAEEGRFSEALAKHMAILQELPAGNELLTGSTYLNIGRIYSYLEMHQEADSAFRKALPIMLKIHFHKGIAWCYLELARIQLNTSPDSAAVMATKALALFKKLNNRLGQADSEVILGIADATHNKVSAQRRLLRALQLSNEVGEIKIRTTALIQLASLKLQANDLDSAILIATQAYDLAVKRKHYPEQVSAAGLLYKANKQSGNQEATIQWLEKRALADDSLHTIESQRLQTQLKLAFDLKQREQQLEIAEIDRALAEQVSLNQQIILLVLVIIVIFILVLVYIQFKRFSIQKSANNLLTVRNEEIRIQRDKLEELTSFKDKIFSIVAHDLRSPLNTLHGMVNLFNKGLVKPDELVPYFKTMDERLKSTSVLVDNLLEWSRVQMSGSNVKMIRQLIKPVFDEAITLFDASIQNKKLTIEQDVPPGLAVHADKEMMNVLIRNLLSNAVKFSPEGSEILLRAREAGDHILIEVVDHGVGMDSTQLASIWNLQKKSTKGTFGELGTGLGLSLCRDMVLLNKGTIEVTSTLKQGTTFTIRLEKG